MVNYKLLQAIPLEVAAMKLQLAEVEDALLDELFTDITESEIMDITKAAFKKYSEEEYMTMKDSAKFVAEAIIKYLSEIDVESISVKDLLELMTYEYII